MSAILVVGYLHGGIDKKKTNQVSADLHDKFKDKFKSTCCRVLTRKFDFNGKERKEFCVGLVEFMLSELADKFLTLKM